MPPKARPLNDRFWEKVNKGGPLPEHRPELGNCWVWLGLKSPGGYGLITTKGHGRFAHRIAFYLARGTRPEQFVLHRCDNRACVRPDHLFEGTRADNIRDMVEKGREAWGSRIGVSKLTADAVRSIRAAMDGGTTADVLAERYGVHVDSVRDAYRRRTWGRLDPGSGAHVARRGHVRGEDNPRARLTTASVLAIRLRLAEGCHPELLATQFGVSASTIYSILAQRTWRHLL